MTDKSTIENIFSTYDLSDAVKEDIRKRSVQAIALGNSSAAVTIYTTSTAQPQGGISTFAMQTRYYSYNNRNIKEDLIYFTTLETGFQTVASGTTADDYAKAIFDLGTIAATRSGNVLLGAAVSLFTDAVSAFQAFSTLCSCSAQTITGSVSDLVQINVRYDINTKYTYVESGGQYVLGAITERGYIHLVNTYEYHVVNGSGKSVSTTQYVFKSYETPNDATAAAKAIIWVGDPWVESLKTKVNGTSVYLDY
ncbi:DUF5022 domain-containing protein [Cohnella yongneupensis]|uniref:DUF5022 domain-containing protein n=1 Tax=Cohnella yongneupensis TaxID=425006 RepID=A0ABW0R5B7_9BACL